MPRSPIFYGSASESERAMRVGAVRMGVGGLLLFAPGLARRLFGIDDKQDNDAVRLVARLFGIRNLVLGYWATQAGEQDAEARRMLYRMNAIVDATDIGILVTAAVFGEGLVQAAVMGSALGTTALLSWMDLLAEAGDGGDQAVALS